MKVILTTTQNQKNSINSNITNIDLGDCENSLKKTYNLSDNDTLYIKMLQIIYLFYSDMCNKNINLHLFE